ncbi:hypothetical protein JNM05_09985 [bacterium]|nr:hypothetical protein [bacterium]
MRIILTSFIMLTLLSSMRVMTQDKKEPAVGEMKQYFFVMLKRGPNRGQDSVTSRKLQEGHMENIERMANEGKLAIAGPFGDNGDWRGIFIFDMKTMEDVIKEVEQDPAIRAGRLSYEIHPWWAERGVKLP